MDRELELGLSFASDETNIRYVSKEASRRSIQSKEIVIESHKLDTCPDTEILLGAIAKKISRSDVLKSQKYTAGICILLLASRGYTVTSSTLANISDTFIERCWECIQVISYTVPDPLQTWLSDTIGSRTPTKYSAMFCQRKKLSPPSKLIGEIWSQDISLHEVSRDTFKIPEVIYHRDDAVVYTMISHIKHL